MLAYQPVCYYGLKKAGVRDFEECYNGLVQTFHTKLCCIMIIIVLLRYNKWKASDNTRQLDDWIKLIHV